MGEGSDAWQKVEERKSEGKKRKKKESKKERKNERKERKGKETKGKERKRKEKKTKKEIHGSEPAGHVRVQGMAMVGRESWKGAADPSGRQRAGVAGGK